MMRIFGWSMRDQLLYDGIPTTVRFFPANNALMDMIWRYFASIDEAFNDFSANSEVSRINAIPEAGTVDVSQAFAHAVAFCLEAGATIPGFDITLRPLRNLWRSAAKQHTIPNPMDVAAVCQRTGHQYLALQDHHLIRHTGGVELDFGGVIKGLAVDHVIRLLQTAGVSAAFIQMGAETAAFGLSPNGVPHVLAFQTVQEQQVVPRWLVDLGTGMSVSSSANDARPICVGKRRLHHIFDPHTGHPISSDVLQAAVYFPRVGANGLAEVLTKACSVVGFERALPILTRYGAEAFVLTRDAGIVRSQSTDHWQRFAHDTPAVAPAV